MTEIADQGTESRASDRTDGRGSVIMFRCVVRESTGSDGTKTGPEQDTIFGGGTALEEDHWEDERTDERNGFHEMKLQ